jgi:hypothetical protein
MGASIVIGNGSDVNPRLLAAAARAIEFVRADIDERGGMTVIRVFEDDEIFVARVGAGETESEFVGFTTGIKEVADFEWSGKKSGEALSVANDVVMEIASVGVEESELLLGGGHDARVGVADERNIVVDIEKGAAAVVVEILAPATNDFQRMAVGDAEISAKEIFAGSKSLVQRRHSRWKRFFGNTKDEIGIGREAGENVALGVEGNAGKIGGEIEQVENDLEVKMGSPATIFGGSTDAGERLTTGNGMAGLEL